MSDESRVLEKYSAALWLKVFLLISTVIVAYIFMNANPNSWTGLALAIIFIVSGSAMLSAISDGVVLKSEELIVTRNFKKNIIEKGEVEDVVWAKGCSISLVMIDGQKIGLPEMNVTPLLFRNVVMKWNNS